LRRCEALLRDTGSVENVLALSGPPLTAGENRGRILARLAGPVSAGARRRLTEVLRVRLVREVREALTVLSDPAAPGAVTPRGIRVALAVHGPEEEEVRRLAQELAASLGSGGKLAGVRVLTWAPSLVVRIDEVKAAALGVSAASCRQIVRIFRDGLPLPGSRG